jgi:hypothetical protein
MTTPTSTEHPVLARVGWILLFIAIKLMVKAMFCPLDCNPRKLGRKSRCQRNYEEGLRLQAKGDHVHAVWTFGMAIQQTTTGPRINGREQTSAEGAAAFCSCGGTCRPVPQGPEGPSRLRQVQEC